MRHNPVKQKIARGEAAFGIWFWPIEATPNRVEYYGHLGFEYAVLDTQAMPAGTDSSRELIRACDVVGMVPIVRPRTHERSELLGYLEMGAMGLWMPGVQTAEQAQAIVNTVKYAPTSKYEPARGKGVSGISRAANYGLTQTNFEHRTQANDETMLIFMMDPVGVSNIDEILEVEDVDVLCTWSPTSFNRYLGHEDPNHPEGYSIVLEAEAKIAASGRPFDFQPDNVEDGLKAMERGARLMAVCDPYMSTPMFREVLDGLRSSAPQSLSATES